MRHFLSACMLVLFSTPAVPAQSKVAMTYETGKTSRLILTGLDPKIFAAAEKLDAPGWSIVAAIVVANGNDEDIAKRPPLLGAWKVAGARLLFEPKFPLREGIKYRALLNQPAILDPTVQTKLIFAADLTIPKIERIPSAKVTAVYPTREVLPENQLKFYIHFSVPMSRGEIYQYVQLLDEKGKRIEVPFLEIDEELWDSSSTRITLLFDPGRVKRGLKSREEEGPVLEEGKRYTLVISKEWKDGNGTPLKEEFRKSFKAGPVDNDPPDPKTWKLETPIAGKTGPLQLRFPKPMDHALLERVLWVVDAKGKKVPGTISVHEEETLWRFTPEIAWNVGEYKIVVETILEDLAANRIGKPFQVELLKPMLKANESKTVELPFKVATSP